MKERTALIIRFIFTHLLLVPFMISFSLVFPKFAVPLLAISQMLLIVIFLTGYWEFLGMKIRIVFALLIEFLIIVLFVRGISHSTQESAGSGVWFASWMVLLYLGYQLMKILMVIILKDDTGMDIAFPFKNGSYLVTDGGNSKTSRLMNYHFYSRQHRRKGTNHSMKYATDIVKLGQSKRGFFPTDNREYAIFSEKVYSPMDGIVFRVENDIADNVPYSGNYPYNTGNTIVIRNKDLYMLLGHLKKGSIQVIPGQRVHADEWIAEAGNSGYSERPHIHIQLIHSLADNYWTGMGLNMTYKNRNLYKNRIIKV